MIFKPEDFINYKSVHPQHISYSEMAKCANEALKKYMTEAGFLKFGFNSKDFEALSSLAITESSMVDEYAAKIANIKLREAGLIK